MIEVRKTVTYLKKENPGAQYQYVSSSQVLANVREKMDELGLILEPAVTGHNVRESVVESKDKDGNVFKRTTTYFTELDMTMTWVNAENPEEKIVKPWYGQGVDIAGEKGVGKALTYAEKYFMLKFFNIATDKDDPDAFQQKHSEGDEPSAGKGKPSQQGNPPPNKPQQNTGQNNQSTGQNSTDGPSDKEFGQMVDNMAQKTCTDPTCKTPKTQLAPEVIEYSLKKFGKVLCRYCQGKHKSA